MERFKRVVLFSFLFLAAGCGSTTRIYYWEKENTGAERFVQDHTKCIQKADYWPWGMANLWPNSSETLDLQLRLKEGGIWGNFSPYTGAQPVFVNTAHPSDTVIYMWYAYCMESAGYRERRPYSGPMAN